MKISAGKMGLAVGCAFAVVWVVCSLMVWLMPSAMMAVTGYMVHADLSMVSWQLSFSGVLAGLVAWSGTAGVTTWIAALVYNRLV